MPIKHAFNNVTADDVVPGTKTQPSHWNANHDLSTMVDADLPAVVRPKPKALKDAPTHYRNFVKSASASSNTFTLNTWRASRVRLYEPANITAYVGAVAGVALAKVSAGLYTSDPTSGLPMTLVADLGAFDVSSTGVKTGNTVDVPAGEYWLVYCTTGATTGSLTVVTAGVGDPGAPSFLLTAGTVVARLDSTSTAVTPVPASLSAVTWANSASFMVSPIFYRVN